MSSNTTTSGSRAASSSSRRTAAKAASPAVGAAPSTPARPAATASPSSAPASTHSGDAAPPPPAPPTRHHRLGRAPPARNLPHHLSQGQEGDALPVGVAVPRDHPRPVLQPRRHLQAQPRLADPGIAQHSDQVAGPAPSGSLECLEDRGQLPLPLEQRRIQPPGEPRRTRQHSHQPPGPHSLLLPLGRYRRHPLDVDRVANEQVGGIANQDLARRTSLLEPGSNVDRIAQHW